MRDGFVKVSVVTPHINVSDTESNASSIIGCISECAKQGAKIIVCPELCITGYSCGDLFNQEILINSAWLALVRIVRETVNIDAIIFVGLPMEWNDHIMDVAVAINRGRIIAIIPKCQLCECDDRYFTQGYREVEYINIDMQGYKDINIPMGGNILLECNSMKGLVIGCEIGFESIGVNASTTSMVARGANIIVNLSATQEVIGINDYRQDVVRVVSSMLNVAYLCASAGEGESTTDVVYAGRNIIAESGKILADNKGYDECPTYSDIDLGYIRHNGRLINNRLMVKSMCDNADYIRVGFEVTQEDTRLDRDFSRQAFVPSEDGARNSRCEEILSIQEAGLRKRIRHIRANKVVIGISGGLDSTLALLVIHRTCLGMGIPTEDIIAVTMPGLGTSDRTYNNACELVRDIGATLIEIPIIDAMAEHFNNIGHDIDVHDITYENAQARERTQILMDLANEIGGLVVGTGDMSELALGWATYNGDHMSMYGLNAGVPKTLVRCLVDYCASVQLDSRIRVVLADILDTPVSPELLPTVGGVAVQRTEDTIGPYELHDYYLYYMLRRGYSPRKIFRIAKKSFEGIYSGVEILKWLEVFLNRFFSQQFKRSCMPDGPRIGSISLSPRGGLVMPSDACAKVWLEEVIELKKEYKNGEEERY